MITIDGRCVMSWLPLKLFVNSLLLLCLLTANDLLSMDRPGCVATVK